MTEIALTRVTDFAALGVRWRALEERAGASFFQGWTWTGCLVEERFPDPILLEATDAGRTVALALFNRRRGVLRQSLWLGETGAPIQDALYIEHNGVLRDRQDGPSTLACLTAARRSAIDGTSPVMPRRLVLSGIDQDTAGAAQSAGPVWLRRRDQAPAVTLRRLRTGGDCPDGLSANTRYQLRRSDRAYQASGPLVLRRAATRAEAHAWLDELAALHQAHWRSRGQPGAFADPFFGRFHHALIDRGQERNELDLLRITAGPHVVGLLYNFRCGDVASAYQSGFDYAGAGRHQKPGLTCHHLAMRFAAAAGLSRYDFLAGEARYKTSFADTATSLAWIEVAEGGQAFGHLSRLSGWLRQILPD